MRTILAKRSDIELRPDEIDVLAKAFDLALMELGAEGETALARQIVADAVMSAALAGERDPDLLTGAGVLVFHYEMASDAAAAPPADDVG